MSRTFIKDRKEGKLAEHFVAERLGLQGFKVSVVPYGKHPIYDLTAVRGRELFYGEVQWDRRSAETGNFALEPLKLRNSQANYFFIVIGHSTPSEAWFCPKAEVQALVESLIGNPTIKQGYYGDPPTFQLFIPKDLFITKIVTKRI